MKVCCNPFLLCVSSFSTFTDSGSEQDRFLACGMKEGVMGKVIVTV